MSESSYSKARKSIYTSYDALIKPSLSLPVRRTMLWSLPRRRSCRGIPGISRGSWLGPDQEPASANVSACFAANWTRNVDKKTKLFLLFLKKINRSRNPTRSLPVKDWPPACSMRNDMGKTSYRTLQNQTKLSRLQKYVCNWLTDAKSE